MVKPDGAFFSIVADGNTTVSQLVRAETHMLDHGETLQVYDGNRPLPPYQLLLSQGKCGPYTLHVVSSDLITKDTGIAVGIVHQGHFHVALLDAGDFLFMALSQCDLKGTARLLDQEGHFFGLDFQVWRCLSLVAVPSSDFTLDVAPSIVGMGHPSAVVSGLSDLTVWHVMQHLVSGVGDLDGPWPLLISPHMAARMRASSMSILLCEELRADFWGSSGEIFCIFAAHQHWALLWGWFSGDGFHWTHFDGLGSTVSWEAFLLATSVSQLLGFPQLTFAECCWQPQLADATCGTIALIHLSMILGLQDGFLSCTELELHHLLLQLPLPHSDFRAFGKQVSDLAEKLSAFLQDRGVPLEAAGLRAAEAIKTLGAGAIGEAFNTPNPWATLKSLASRPSTRFRWVREDELKAHIVTQAKKKDGVHVPNAKTKKHASKGPTKLPR